MDSRCEASSIMYGLMCEKCLHPLERHSYVLTKADGKVVKRCEIGVCTCVIMTQVEAGADN